jgi:thiamine biosynthesis protein ThiI
MNDFLLRTDEIILKGKNRPYFERILKNNLKKKFKEDLIFIKNLGGVFWTRAKKDLDFKKIFGIKNFSPVKVFENLGDVLKEIKKLNLENFKSFKVEAKRGSKDYPLTSLEIRQKISDFIISEFNLEINNQNPEITIYLYYKNKKFFLYKEKIECFGGLPVGSSGKGLVLLSAGFDSPVASFLSMKRGLKVYFLHFHSYPQTSKESLEKVEKLVKVLNEYNFGSELYLMNILELQKFYYQNVPHKFLVIFYRRSMFRLANKLAQKLKLDTLITGESLGQVSSQTIQNIKVINYGIQTFVIRPLLGFNKLEIIELAKKIGTYEISLLKGDDCCSLFLPKNVATKADLKEILKIEEKLKEKIENLENLIIPEVIKYQ